MRWMDARTDTLRHRVGKCPACREYLWAEVRITTEVNLPTLDDEGKTVAYAVAHPVSMDLEHHCDRSDEPK